MKSKRFLNFNTRSRDCPNLKVYNIPDNFSIIRQKTINIAITKR